jgi:hypothetical protein
MKQIAIRLRDWWRGYSDDDLRVLYEWVDHLYRRPPSLAHVGLFLMADCAPLPVLETAFRLRARRWR